MALKDLVIKRRRKRQPSPTTLVTIVLKSFGVSAPKATAEAVIAALKQAKILYG